MPDTSPPSDSAPVSVSILADGRSIGDGLPLFSVDTWCATGAAASARLVLGDGDIGGFPPSESGPFAPGVALEISLGYGAQARCVFRGTVHALSLDIGADCGPRLVVDALGSAADHEPASPEPALVLGYGNAIHALKVRHDQREPGMRGEVRFQGSSLALPGATITLAGLGQRFNGNVRLTGVHHRVADGDWSTVASFGPPAQGDAARRSLATRGGMRADLDDEGGTLSLSTPFGQRVRLDDGEQAIVIQDANGNTIRMGRDGIQVNSQGNLTLAAAGDIALSAQGTLALEGRAGVSIDGLNIAANADMNFSAHAAAGARLAADGEVIVSGAMVMIN